MLHGTIWFTLTDHSLCDNNKIWLQTNPWAIGPLKIKEHLVCSNKVPLKHKKEPEKVIESINVSIGICWCLNSSCSIRYASFSIIIFGLQTCPNSMWNRWAKCSTMEKLFGSILSAGGSTLRPISFIVSITPFRVEIAQQ